VTPIVRRVSRDSLATSLHQTRIAVDDRFLVHGANFHLAVSLADRLSMDQSFVALN
jgi:hypothetical protein